MSEAVALKSTATSRLPGALAGSPSIESVSVSLKTNEIARFRLGMMPQKTAEVDQALTLAHDTIGRFLGEQQAYLLTANRGSTPELTLTNSWESSERVGWLVNLSFAFGLRAPSIGASFEDGWAYLKQLDLRVYDAVERARMVSEISKIKPAASIAEVVENLVRAMVLAAEEETALRGTYLLPTEVVRTIADIRAENEPRLNALYRFLQDSRETTLFPPFADPAFFEATKKTLIVTLVAILTGATTGAASDFFQIIQALASSFALTYIPSTAAAPFGRLVRFDRMVGEVSGEVVLPSDGLAASVDSGRRPTRAVTITAHYANFHRDISQEGKLSGVYGTFGQKVVVAYPPQLDTGSQGAVAVDPPAWLPNGEVTIPQAYLDIQVNDAGLNLQEVKQQLDSQIKVSNRLTQGYLLALRWYAQMRYAEIQLSKASLQVNLPLESVKELTIGRRVTLKGEDQKVLGRGTVVSMEITVDAQAKSAQCFVGFGYCEFNGFTYDE